MTVPNYALCYSIVFCQPEAIEWAEKPGLFEVVYGNLR